MGRKEIHRTQWTCDWKCGGRNAVTYTDGKQVGVVKPEGWLRLLGGGEPGSGDPYPIHLCPDCADLYNDCKDGKSDRGKRFRAAYKLFRDAEQAFIDAPEPDDYDDEPEVARPLLVGKLAPRRKATA